MQSKILAQGRWLTLQEITYLDPSGQTRKWECARRVGTGGAAAIVATVEKDGEPHLVVVKQFRPPANGAVLELPAGLIDSGENAEGTAIRELAEETGFQGQVTSVGPFVYNSPGLSDEKVAVVVVGVTSQTAANPDGGEAIEVLTFPLCGLKSRLLEEEMKGTQLDAKLWCFALGLDFIR